jgi:hypothetical protein
MIPAVSGEWSRREFHYRAQWFPMDEQYTKVIVVSGSVFGHEMPLLFAAHSQRVPSNGNVQQSRQRPRNGTGKSAAEDWTSGEYIVFKSIPESGRGDRQGTVAFPPDQGLWRCRHRYRADHKALQRLPDSEPGDPAELHQVGSSSR